MPSIKTDVFLNQEEVAALLRLSERTLERWRCTGAGVPYIKFGKRVLYARSDIDEWARNNTFRSTAEAGTHAS